jgi:hypothetical protein
MQKSFQHIWPAPSYFVTLTINGYVIYLPLSLETFISTFYLLLLCLIIYFS